jgi:hypothetical protein
MQNNYNNEAKALWESRQPDDSFHPTAWVRVYIWRFDGGHVTLTELEGETHIHRRLDARLGRDIYPSALDTAPALLKQCLVKVKG